VGPTQMASSKSSWATDDPAPTWWLEHCFTVEQVDLSGAMLEGMLPQESWGIYYIVVYLLVNVYITMEITIFHG
jgi:hypothetical protein